MRDDIRRMALFGSGVAELTRNRAEQLAKELLERSKQNRDDIVNLVRGEIRNQLASLGLASKRELERLERRVARLEGGGRPARTTSTATRKRTSAKRSTKTTSSSGRRPRPTPKTDPSPDGS